MMPGGDKQAYQYVKPVLEKIAAQVNGEPCVTWLGAGAEGHFVKQITFDNTYYRIDLVFYHRILKCHVLLDLKIGEFDHFDAGQMNMYLNYYKDNESANGDNNPIRIILCSGKNEALVKYATMGLPQPVFVSKYLINLPSEKELQKIIEEEKEKNSCNLN